MHQRNPFRLNPPKFGELAKRYTELRPFCFIGTGGKVQINFDNHATAACLSAVLLREYFDLRIEFPSNALVPRVPQKVNYVLLVEDLLNANGIHVDVSGVDIGTGASCIYSLLAATMNPKWRLFATELAESSRTAAVANVERNRRLVADRIVVVPTSSSYTIFRELFEQLENGVVLTFSMCNPPFFTDEEEEMKFGPIDDEVDTVSNMQLAAGRRGAPRSSTTASRHELSTAGGEVGFVMRMIAESRTLRDRIRIFTTMLGKKSSLSPLIDLLRDVDGVRFTEYTLEQGRTGRWVLAWTYQADIQLPKF